MDSKIIEQIIRKYDIKATKILPTQIGYRNNSYPIRISVSETANLIMYKSEPGILDRIQRTNKISDFLNTAGLPTRKTLDPRIIRVHNHNIVRYGAIYNYLPGHTISWEAYTRNHIKALGMVMSHMHAALRQYNLSKSIDVADEYIQILRRIIAYFSDTGVQKAMGSKLHLIINIKSIQRSLDLLKICSHLPGKQALHMDLVRGNVLFDTVPAPTKNRFSVGRVAVTGILDFEKNGIGHPILDIARTLSFLLVDCKYKTERKIRKYFLLSGYNKRGTSKVRYIFIRNKDDPKIDLLENLIDLFLIHDFYKFLLHNPYEALVDNEHFVRTRNLLLKRNVIVRTSVKINGAK